MDKPTFGLRLRTLRKERHLRQSELGAALGLSPSAIGSYERDLREPAYHHLIGFADFFGVSVDYLIGRTEERPTVESYIATDEYDFSEMIHKFKIKVHGYELNDDDKRRLLDISVGLFWNRMTE